MPKHKKEEKNGILLLSPLLSDATMVYFNFLEEFLMQTSALKKLCVKRKRPRKKHLFSITIIVELKNLQTPLSFK